MTAPREPDLAAVPLRADGTPDPNAVPLGAVRTRRSTERARARAAEASRRHRKAAPTGPLAAITGHPAYRHLSTMFPIFIVLAVLATAYVGIQAINAPKPTPGPSASPSAESLAQLSTKFEQLKSVYDTIAPAGQQEVADGGSDVKMVHAGYSSWQNGATVFANGIQATSWGPAATQASALVAALQHESDVLGQAATADLATIKTLETSITQASDNVTKAETEMDNALNPFLVSPSPGASDSAGPSGSAAPSESASPSASGAPSASASAS